MIKNLFKKWLKITVAIASAIEKQDLWLHENLTYYFAHI